MQTAEVDRVVEALLAQAERTDAEASNIPYADERRAQVLGIASGLRIAANTIREVLA